MIFSCITNLVFSVQYIFPILLLDSHSSQYIFWVDRIKKFACSSKYFTAKDINTFKNLKRRHSKTLLKKKPSLKGKLSSHYKKVTCHSLFFRLKVC